MTLDLNISRPRHTTGLAVRDRSGEHLIEDPAGERRFALNPTALAVWDLCDGVTTPAEMVDAMCILFDAPRERLQRDVARLLDDLLALGLVEGIEVAE
jgi:pyrroloquinoline quinone biosynthesis protein D